MGPRCLLLYLILPLQGNYLQQTTSADDIFPGALRVDYFLP